MPHSPDHMLSASALARNDAVNPHGVPMDRAEKKGAAMGVPANHVVSSNRAQFTGTVTGREGNNLIMSSGSTDGGESDTHVIGFSHPSMKDDASFDKHFGGKNWTASGEYRAGDGKMHWNLEESKDR